MNVIDELRNIVEDKQKTCTSEDFTIRGIWRTDLLFRPNMNERVFEYTYVLMQTLGQGCAYCCEEPIIDKAWMGMDARKVDFAQESVRLAALDAIFSAFPENPSERFYIDGTSIEKTRSRTAIVVNEVMRLARSLAEKGRRTKVVNVGVVGNFISSLSELGFDVHGTDMDCSLVGKQINGVQVDDGSYTLARVAEADIALVTGMVLGNGTFDAIYEAAKESGTRLIMFNETGANLGAALCRLGVDCVIGEPFPFYIFQGQSRIDIYRGGRL